MKKLLKTSFLLLALLSVVFVSCKKDYPEPPIQVLPIGTVYTIDQILAMEPGTVFTEDASVYGIITADEQSGNLYKSAFMQDRATGAALELHLDAVSGVRIGDSIRVYLKDVTYSTYFNLPQLSNFTADGHIVILANNKDIEPAKATIADINQGKYLAGLVRLENVKFTEQNTFADASTYGNRTLIDALDPSNNVIVRTSNYANFAYDSLPQGTGNLTAIASVYNSTWQLCIRSAYELDFEDYVPGGNTGLPYFQDFATSFGTYSTYSVLGDEEWMIDYNTAKMTGHVGSSNHANEDWLISAPVALTGVDHVKVCVNYAAMYQNSNTEDVTLQISRDYKTGTNPLDANWIQMPVTYPNSSSWSDFKTIETSLDEFLGETVTVAIKFTCTESQSRTIEVKYILVQEGQPGDGPTPPGPGGDGELQSMPYIQSFESEFGTYTTKDVLGPQSWIIDYKTAKMTGYAGSSHANEDWLISSPVAVTGVSEAKVSVNYSAQYQSSNARDVTLQVSTDYVYGNDPSTATWTEMTATYPNTSSFNDFQTVETSLNEFIGQNVTVAIKYTSTDSQSRTIEIKSITVQEGHADGGETPPTPPTPGEVIGDGSRENPYTANDIILLGVETSDGNKYWVKDYIVGAINTLNNYAYEFTSSTTVKTNLILSSNLNTTAESECIPVQLPAGEIRDGLNVADNPSNYRQEVLLYGTLEKYFKIPGVKNVTYAEINGNSFGNDPGGNPPTPPTPGETIFSETFANGQGDFAIMDVNLPEALSYVWIHASQYSCMKASAFVSGQNYAAESWLVSPAIDLSGVSSATLKFEQAVNYASPDALSIWVSTNYNGDIAAATWTQLSVSSWPAGNNWTFISSTADLSNFIGQTVTIAFKYTSTNSASATWEVKNFVVE